MNVLTEFDDARWWEIVDSSEAATFYHTPHWTNLICDSFPSCRDRSVLVELNDDNRGVIPIVETDRSRFGVWNHRVSTYGGGYGGLIPSKPISETGRASLYQSLIGWRTSTLKVNGNPLTSEPTDALKNFQVDEDFTQLLAFDSGSDVRSRYSRGNRSNIHKAENEGVRIRRAESGEDIDTYFEAYRQSLERWGKNPEDPPYPRELFHNLFSFMEEGREPEPVALWLAEKGNTILSGAVLFYFNDHVSYWHGASFEEHLDLRPNNLLHDRAIHDAMERGYAYYDLNPSGGHQGVVEFKDSFGPERREFKRITHDGPKRSILKSVLAGLP